MNKHPADWLWTFIQLQNMLPGNSPERIQGETALAFKDDIIVDQFGKKYNQREILVLLGTGKNEKELRKAYAEGKRAKFDLLINNTISASHERNEDDSEEETEEKSEEVTE